MMVATVIGCSSTMSTAQFNACHRDQARHFKTEATETVRLCFGCQLILCQLTKEAQEKDSGFWLEIRGF
jgi:hypothetical protein